VAVKRAGIVGMKRGKKENVKMTKKVKRQRYKIK
jgi:hypothetical protein